MLRDMTARFGAAMNLKADTVQVFDGGRQF
jgi:hypothetical protein